MKVDTENMKDFCLHGEKPIGTRCTAHGRRWVILYIANEVVLEIAFSLSNTYSLVGITHIFIHAKGH